MKEGFRPSRRRVLKGGVAGLAFLCLGGMAIGCASGEEQTGAVLNVLEGDLLKMDLNGRRVRVQLAGVDSPVRGQPYRDEAREFTVRMVQDKQVKVRPVERGKAGHVVAEVLLPDGRILNRELVAAGLGWHRGTWLARYPSIRATERQARQARRGLWRDDDPIPPWEYLANKSWRD